jgi:hypothetical protein
MLDSITGFFYKLDNVHSISGKILPREEMSEFKGKSKDPQQLDRLVISEVPVNAMSASFVRNIVKNGRRDKFFELYSPYLDEDKIISSHRYRLADYFSSFYYSKIINSFIILHIFRYF